MKPKYFLWLFVFALGILFTQCKKDGTTPEDSHNHSLLKKTLPQIQAEITGRWQIKRTYYEVCGIAGCDTTNTVYNNNDEDLVSFFSNDTVRQTGYLGTPIKLYEHANIVKVSTGGTLPVDSIYQFEMASGYYIWAMSEIKNDSLVIFAGTRTHYLLRKP